MKHFEIKITTDQLLLGSEARKHIGFYSEREFDLENLKTLRGEVLELGRSCARKDFRDKALIEVTSAGLICSNWR